MYEKNLKKTKKQQENCTKVGKSAKKRRNQSGYAFFFEVRSEKLLQFLVSIDGTVAELLLDADELVVLGHAVAAAE